MSITFLSIIVDTPLPHGLRRQPFYHTQRCRRLTFCLASCYFVQGSAESAMHRRVHQREGPGAQRLGFTRAHCPFQHFVEIANTHIYPFSYNAPQRHPRETTMLTDTIKAALLEELRFAKRQQWTITAAVVGLIAGAYTIAVEKRSLDAWEKAVAAILIVAVVVAGIYWLLDLQRHLYHTRLRIDRWDPDPWWRGSEIVTGMAGAMIISAIVVCYLLLRDGAYELLLNMLLLFAVPTML